jgi:transposase
LLSDGAKTDAIDAGKLCQLLRAGLLKEVYHTTNDIFELRRFISAYEDLVKSGVRLKNQRKALYQGHGESGAEAGFILQHIDNGISLYETTKKQYEQRFKDLSAQHRPAQLLQEILGIGVIGSLTILAIVVDARRFPRSSHYLVYCGLVHFRKLSGGRDYGKRTARYNHTLKRVYKLAAMSAISSANNPLREYYDTLRTRGVADHNARHAVARYIARITYGMLKTETHYRPYASVPKKSAA